MNDPQGFQIDYESKVFKSLDKYFGLLALSKRWDSILMWSHYSSNHTGFSIGFYTDKLWQTGLFGKAANVSYDERFPEIKPKIVKSPGESGEQFFKMTFQKSKDWTYEEEFRLVKNFYPKAPQPFERIVTVPDAAFAEVILGIDISDNDQREIKAICKAKGIPVYQAIKKNFRFEIDRKPVIS